MLARLYALLFIIIIIIVDAYVSSCRARFTLLKASQWTMKNDGSKIDKKKSIAKIRIGFGIVQKRTELITHE